MSNNVIAATRDIVPIRPLTTPDALRVAELQATKFLLLSGLTDAPLPEAAISKLPRIQVERIFPAPSSGATQWSLGRWLILVNAAHTNGKQRFTLAHEFKHILDHPFIQTLYPPIGDMTSDDRAEAVCNYFAACLLMPRVWIKRAWMSGTQDVRELARKFEVSNQAMQIRLEQLGLTEPVPRCLPSAIPSGAM